VPVTKFETTQMLKARRRQTLALWTIARRLYNIRTRWRRVNWFFWDISFKITHYIVDKVKLANNQFCGICGGEWTDELPCICPTISPDPPPGEFKDRDDGAYDIRYDYK